MFFRSKRSGPRTYLQIVENRREGDYTRQRVIATLSRLDQLQASGQLEALLCSGARFAEAILVLTAHARGEAPTLATRRIGPPGPAGASAQKPTVLNKSLSGNHLSDDG
jgi:hypothetical protein